MISVRTYVITFLIMSAVMLMIILVRPTTTHNIVRTQDHVTSYNDGFMDGKGECK